MGVVVDARLAVDWCDQGLHESSAFVGAPTIGDVVGSASDAGVGLLVLKDR